MKPNKIHIALLATLASGSLSAGTMGPVAPTWRPVVTLSLGPAWVDGFRARDVIYSENIIRRFNAANNDNAIFSGEGFIGVEQSFGNFLGGNFLGQLGIAVAGNSDIKIRGSVWDDALPEFDNFVYNYKLSHIRVGVKAKLIGDYGFWAQPYISGSADAGFNRSNNFFVAPTIPEAVPFAPFGRKSTTSFAYTAGIGLEKAFGCWRAGVGYEFAGLGRNNLGLAPGQLIGSGLSNHFYTHELQFSLSYVA